MRQSRPRSPRNVDLARIHIGAQKLGLIRPGDDSAYRDMLSSIARVRSASELGYHGRTEVIKHLDACGANVGAHQDKPRRRYAPRSIDALIRHLWTMLAAAGVVEDSSDLAMRRWLASHALAPRKRASGIESIAPQHLNGADANRAVEQLKKWCQRVGISNEMIRDGEVPGREARRE